MPLSSLFHCPHGPVGTPASQLGPNPSCGALTPHRLPTKTPTPKLLPFVDTLSPCSTGLTSQGVSTVVVCPSNKSRKAGTELTLRSFSSHNSTLLSMAAAASPGECPLCCSPTWRSTPDCLLGATPSLFLAGVPCSLSLGRQDFVGSWSVGEGARLRPQLEHSGWCLPFSRLGSRRLGKS